MKLNKKVIIACCDEKVRRILKKCLLELKRYSDVTECGTEKDVFLSTREAEEPVLFIDKYFLGYVISYKIVGIRLCNEKTELCFCETGECPPYFGLRLYDLKVDAFIAHIEESDHFKREISKVLCGYKTYPDEVQKSIDDNSYLLERKCFTEITPVEMKIAAYLGEGKTQKEICYIMGISPQAVNTHVHRIKRKIGYKNPMDYCILNQQAFFQGK